MNISKEFIIESYFPVPVLMDFFGNPEFFFSSTVHISVMRRTGKDNFEMAILPYTDEVKNVSYYGTLELQKIDFNTIGYKIRSINFGEHFEMDMIIEIARIEKSSRIHIKWDVMAESDLSYVLTKSSASLNPEHMVTKHIEPFIREIEKISDRMDSEEKYMFEKVKKEPMESVPYLTDKMEEMPGFIATGFSENSEFYAEVQDKKFRKIIFRKMAMKSEGGEAIMAILNEKSQFEIKLFFPEFGLSALRKN